MKPTCSVEGCERIAAKRGWCVMHYTRWYHGRDLAAPPRPPTRNRSDLLAFLKKGAASTTDECLILNPYASGKRTTLRWEGRARDAARIVWFIAHGDPGDLLVLHRCNGGSGEHGCINIRHLYLGTYADNARDRTLSGRGARGERNGPAKLSDEDVRYIRSLYDSGAATIKELAQRFALNDGNMSRVVHRKTWRHLP